MIRTINFLIVCVLLFAFGCDTANNVDPVFEKYFIKYYGSSGDQSGADLLVNEDGSMILLGNSILPSGEYTAFVIKVNKQGDVIWKRQIGGLNETAVDVELIKRGTHQGHLIIALNIGPEASSRIRLLRVTQHGVGIDSLEVPLHANGVKQVVRSITSLGDNDGYIITGYADKALMVETEPVMDNIDQGDILAFRIDESLTQIENIVSTGGELFGSGIKVFELPSSPTDRFVIFSFSDKPVSSGFEFNFRFDAPELGVPSKIGGVTGADTEDEILASVIQTYDEPGFLLAGTSRTQGSVGGELYLVKYNTTFDDKTLDQKILLSRAFECVAAENGPSSSYFILGNEVAPGNSKNIMLIKVRGDGSFEEIGNFGTNEGDDTGAALSILPDGRIAIVATMSLETRKKVALIILNGNGGLSK